MADLPEKSPVSLPDVPDAPEPSLPPPSIDALEGDAALDAILAGESGESAAEETPPAPEPPPVAETAPEPPPAAPSVDERVAQGLEQLMAREREFREKQRELEEQRSALSNDRQSLERLRKYEALEQRLHEKDALGALEALGVDFDSLSEAVLNGTGVSPQRKMMGEVEKRLAEMQEAYDQKIKQLEAVEQRRLQQETFSQLQKTIDTAEDVVFLRAVGDLGRESVIQNARTVYAQTGQAPSYEDSVRAVESEWRGLIEKIMGHEQAREWIRTKFFNTGSTPQSSGDKSRVTLTNQRAAEVASRKTNNPIPDDRDEAIDAILSEFR